MKTCPKNGVLTHTLVRLQCKQAVTAETIRKNLS
jgi:hypothetical protein